MWKNLVRSRNKIVKGIQHVLQNEHAVSIKGGKERKEVAHARFALTGTVKQNPIGGIKESRYKYDLPFTLLYRRGNVFHHGHELSASSSDLFTRSFIAVGGAYKGLLARSKQHMAGKRVFETRSIHWQAQTGYYLRRAY